ncbi:hypothetical protein [Sphingobacterium sp. UME9]|uniref:hypothetical protein n=1 Tax=Sphingobacterium sp. UME9 TaxID=1862316 RepID=UPI001603838B|nr:hypothetical protein [Sphingobacterium sp. UME9]
MGKEEKDFLSGFVGGVLVIGVILGLYVNSFAPENTAENITAVVSVLALIVSSVALFYLYRTYQTQREEIAEQKKELLRNKKDVEYNRALDIIYKHIDYTLPLLDKLQTLKKDIEGNSQAIWADFNRMGFNNQLIPYNFQTSHEKKVFVETVLSFESMVYDYSEEVNMILNLYISIVYNSSFNESEVKSLSLIVRQTFFDKLRKDVKSVHSSLNRIMNLTKGVTLDFSIDTVASNTERIEREKKIEPLLRDLLNASRKFQVMHNHNKFEEYVSTIRANYDVN